MRLCAELPSFHRGDGETLRRVASLPRAGGETLRRVASLSLSSLKESAESVPSFSSFSQESAESAESVFSLFSISQKSAESVFFLFSRFLRKVTKSVSGLLPSTKEPWVKRNKNVKKVSEMSRNDPILSREAAPLRRVGLPRLSLRCFEQKLS